MWYSVITDINLLLLFINWHYIEVTKEIIKSESLKLTFLV